MEAWSGDRFGGFHPGGDVLTSQGGREGKGLRGEMS